MLFLGHMMGVAWVSYGNPSFGMLIDQGNRSDLIAVAKVTTKNTLFGPTRPRFDPGTGLAYSQFVCRRPPHIREELGIPVPCAC